MNRLPRCLLFLILLVSFPSLVMGLEKAYIIKGEANYRGISSFKSISDPVFIHKDTGTVLSFGRFEDDKDPEKNIPWDVYDVLYEDVPQSYEIALLLLGQGEYESALQTFLKSSKDKTPSGKTFSSTPFWKNYMDYKLLVCSLALEKFDDAKSYFDKISSNKDAHHHIVAIRDYIPYIIRQSEGKTAQQWIDYLLGFSLSEKAVIELKFQRIKALALQKKYPEAKDDLKKIQTAYLEKFPDLSERIDSLQSDILILYEKNYIAGTKFLEEKISADRRKANADIYRKLAICYVNRQDLHRARWNYMQAYLSEADPQKTREILLELKKVNNDLKSKDAENHMDPFLDHALSNTEQP
ncbi:MAG: hypothetical protein HQL31_00630 [Planctomycetes bacterium]|nr:hypothetical protein [Planctomycetota bacterium]